MFINKHIVNVTADDQGDGIGYTPIVNGRILGIRYIKASSGAFADTVDFDVTSEDSGVVVWDEDNVTASKTIVPRQATHSTAGVAALFAAEGTAVNDFVYVGNERIKISVANAGDGGAGQFVVLVG